MQAFSDGGGIDEISTAQDAGEVRIEIHDLQARRWRRTKHHCGHADFLRRVMVITVGSAKLKKRHEIDA